MFIDRNIQIKNNTPGGVIILSQEKIILVGELIIFLYQIILSIIS
jgi:hypothetical protein